MTTMALIRPTVLQRRRIPLTAGPAAAAEARIQLRAAIRGWDIPVDPDVAVLLTCELVTNAIKHAAGEAILIVITCSGGQLRVEVHDTCCLLPVMVDAPTDSETGRGLMLVTSLSTEWGTYRTPAGKAVYFTLAFEPDLGGSAERGPRGVQTWVR
jgi:anti-sigma regulatory factor (Ser/Thr protein kinase)